MKKQTLVKKINTGEVTVKFIKGDERIMRCTTCLDKIPSEHHPKGTGPKMEDAAKALSDRVNVYDLDACGWRSFNYTNFIEIL